MTGPMLALRDVRFAYRPNRDELFGGLSHEFPAGAVTAVTGPSGRGKSTLLYLMALLLTPTAGEVLVGGRSVANCRDSERSRIRATRIGFVFQDAELDPARTVLRSVMEPSLYAGALPGSRMTRARGLLERFGLAERADHRPGQVSGGQAQRVAVCRALINDPAIILADEPTGNLDRDNSILVLDALAEASASGATVVIATHDPAVLERVDGVLSL
ncbi:ABC transporter ATP-binding protein [Micropruina sp.]|uniref:ABC transporter ATP-binding protein n=1 Tax=Micropruina sp. TaxID=2737536 RepID=UPI0039E530FA